MIRRFRPLRFPALLASGPAALAFLALVGCAPQPTSGPVDRSEADLGTATSIAADDASASAADTAPDTATPAAKASLCTRCSKDDCAFLLGINLAGAEFAGGQIPGVEGQHFRWPSESALDYWKGTGVRLVRLPFKWERLQPELLGEFDPAYRDGLLRSVRWMSERDMLVIPDLHNYAKYRGKNIGSPEVSAEAFADVWRRLALLLKDEPAIWGYGLMNEPTGGVDWPGLTQLAIDAIRGVDATTMILVANDYAGWAATYQKGNLADWAEKSLKIGNPSLLRDPANNLRYELHTYFDHDNSGLYHHSYAKDAERGSRVSPSIGIARIRPFVEWLERHNARGFIGEFGCPANPKDDPRWLTVLDNTLGYMRENCLPGTIWAAGEMWTPGMGYVAERRGWSRDLPEEARLRDRPQTLLLRKHMEPRTLKPESQAQLERYLKGEY